MYNKALLDKKIAESVAVTGNQAETARQLDISKATVCRRMQNDDVKAMIEAEQAQFFQSLPKARENIQFLIENYLALDEEGSLVLPKDDRDKAWKSSMEMLRASGMLPSHSPSTFVQNIYQQTNNMFLNPIIQDLLAAQGQEMLNIIEVEGALVEKENETN